MNIRHKKIVNEAHKAQELYYELREQLDNGIGLSKESKELYSKCKEIIEPLITYYHHHNDNCNNDMLISSILHELSHIIGNYNKYDMKCVNKDLKESLDYYIKKACGEYE